MPRQAQQEGVSTRVAPPIRSNGVPNSFIKSLERVNAPREVIERLKQDRDAVRKSR